MPGNYMRFFTVLFNTKQVLDKDAWVTYIALSPSLVYTTFNQGA